ncbi:MAG: TIGR02206 family membrane protein [Rhizomicrobium sp.]
MQPPFVLFGPAHIAVMCLSFMVPVLLALMVRADDSRVADRMVRWGFAALLIANWVFWYGLFWRRGWLNWSDVLPMNLCDWAAVAAIVALLGRNQRAYELAYFWALAGTLQGLITPATPYGFPEVRFIIFSVSHGGLIAAVLYLTFGTRMRPHVSALLPVIGWSLFYAAAAGSTDWLLNVDYGFLRAKPANVSLFDFMPAWPRYIPVLILLGFASALVYYAPWFLADLIRGRRIQPSAGASPKGFSGGVSAR